MTNDVTKVGEVSNFVTDDGKDLDERYLGINAKAKSAESADYASSADSVSWDGVSGKPGLQIQTATSDYVTVAAQSFPWTAPVDCFIKSVSYSNTSNNNYMRINGKRIGLLKNADDGASDDLRMYVCKGDVLSSSSYAYLRSLIYIPYKIL